MAPTPVSSPGQPHVSSPGVHSDTELSPKKVEALTKSLKGGLGLIDGLKFEARDVFAYPIVTWKCFVSVSPTDFDIPAYHVAATFCRRIVEMLEICFEYEYQVGLMLSIEDFALMIHCYWDKKPLPSVQIIVDILRPLLRARRRFTDMYPDQVDSSHCDRFIEAIDTLITMTTKEE
ncbi:hypothetical protein F5Y14DRAFT_294833 [Nemania sp. NC0429]|nr:hypothetical protein F5Y14DRAFT_294833 [Nemania sp. NC0429]